MENEDWIDELFRETGTRTYKERIIRLLDTLPDTLQEGVAAVEHLQAAVEELMKVLEIQKQIADLQYERIDALVKKTDRMDEEFSLLHDLAVKTHIVVESLAGIALEQEKK